MTSTSVQEVIPRQQRRSSFMGSLTARLFRGSANNWVCDYCTYHNTNQEFLSCEMCGMVRALPKTEENQDTTVIISSEPSSPKGSCETFEVEMERRQEQADRKILEDRMREVIERQRCLYNELAEHRVNRRSILELEQAQNSIVQIQQQIDTENEDGANLVTVLMPVSMDADPQEEEKMGEDPPPSSLRKSAVRKSRSRNNSLFRRSAANQIHQNPVETMEINPWEDGAMGMNEILKCQEELWDRVKTSDKKKPPPQQQQQPTKPGIRRFPNFFSRSKKP